MGIYILKMWDVMHGIDQGCVEVEVGEAMNFFETLSWAKSMNLEKVVIEGDVNVVLDAVNSKALNYTVF
ncbi:hypothetical protein ACS0TY_030236 [Phlomoides rotata]